MRLFRPISIVLGLAILLLSTGDCVNLLFADSKQAECCMRADCPFFATEQMDSCCKTPTVPAKYIQSASHQSLSQPSVTYVDFPTERLADRIVSIAARFSTDAKLHSPPTRLIPLNTPLLI